MQFINKNKTPQQHTQKLLEKVHSKESLSAVPEFLVKAVMKPTVLAPDFVGSM